MNPERSQRTRDRWFMAVTAAAFLYAIGPPMVQTFTAPKFRVNAGQPTVPPSALAAHASTLSLLLLLGVCVLAIVLALGELPRTGVGRIAVLVLPWFYLVARDLSLAVPLHKNFLVYPLVCTAVWCLRPRIAALQVLGYLVGATAVASLVMGQFLPAKGIYQAATGTEISADKEIFSSGLLVGPLSNGNNLGQFLVMGLAAIFLVRRSSWRWLFVVATLVAGIWAASRSCLAASAALLVLGGLLRLTPLKARPGITAAVLLPWLGLIVALPTVTTDPLAFTNRGYVWQVCKQAWASDPWFGLGSNFFGRIAASSQNLGGSVFHGHNQYMQDLVIGGYALAVLMGLAVLVELDAVLRLARRGHLVPVLFMVGFLGASTLEVSFVLVDRFFALPVMLVPFACFLFTADLDAPLPPAGRDAAVARVQRAAGRVPGRPATAVGAGRSSRQLAAGQRLTSK